MTNRLQMFVGKSYHCDRWTAYSTRLNVPLIVLWLHDQYHATPVWRIFRRRELKRVLDYVTGKV